MRGWMRNKPGPAAAALLAGSALIVLAGSTTAGAAPAAGPAPGAATAPAAGTAWTIQNTPNVVVPTGQLYATSCSSPSACTAVGSYVSRSGLSAALAERWNGTARKRPQTPNPAGGHAGLGPGFGAPKLEACRS